MSDIVELLERKFEEWNNNTNKKGNLEDSLVLSDKKERGDFDSKLRFGYWDLLHKPKPKREYFDVYYKKKEELECE